MKVEIYTKSYCLYSQRAKELLRIRDIAFTEYDVTGDSSRAAEMLRRGQGQAAPVILINDQLVGGCSALFDLDERGELDLLLSRRPAESP